MSDDIDEAVTAAVRSLVAAGDAWVGGWLQLWGRVAEVVQPDDDVLALDACVVMVPRGPTDRAIWVGPLVDPDSGTVLPPGCCELVPAVVEKLAPAGGTKPIAVNAKVELHAKVPKGTPPGVYEGWVFADADMTTRLVDVTVTIG